MDFKQLDDWTEKIFSKIYLHHPQWVKSYIWTPKTLNTEYSAGQLWAYRSEKVSDAPPKKIICLTNTKVFASYVSFFISKTVIAAQASQIMFKIVILSTQTN